MIHCFDENFIQNNLSAIIAYIQNSGCILQLFSQLWRVIYGQVSMNHAVDGVHDVLLVLGTKVNNIPGNGQTHGHIKWIVGFVNPVFKIIVKVQHHLVVLFLDFFVWIMIFKHLAYHAMHFTTQRRRRLFVIGSG